jgi:inner membrane protein
MAGFASLLTVSAYYPPTQISIATVFACLIANVIGSLIPDMDQATNRLWDLLPAGNIVGKVLRKLMISHRTISHSFLGIIIIFKLASVVIPKLLNPAFIQTDLVIISLMVGFTAHIAADMFTKEGVPLFFPVKYDIGIPPLSFLRITTGKFMEKFIVFPGVIIYMVWLVATKHAIFLQIARLIKS